MHILTTTQTAPRSPSGGHTTDLAWSHAAPQRTRLASVIAALPGALSAVDWLAALLDDVPGLAELAQFSPECYVRTRLYQDALREVYLVGWLPGQASVIHDHGAAECGYGVVLGCLDERTYRLGEERIEALQRYRWSQGTRLHRPHDAIHGCGNADDAASRLVTLHVYARAQRPARTYEAAA